MNRNEIRADILNNLVVNHEAGSGQAGVAITNFLKTQGVDASLERITGDEFYVIVFNPDIIKKVSVVDHNKITNFLLPVNR